MNKVAKKTIIVVDLSVKQTSPAGSCILSELLGLSDFYKIHLLATEADDELQKKVVFHKIQAPSAPLVLRYITFSRRVKSKMRQLIKNIDEPYIIQTTQGQFIDSTVSYPHFCHRAYLKNHWKKSSIKGVRRFMRKLNHIYHAGQEKKAFNNVEVIITPSKGLARELKETYPFTASKIRVIANPVDTLHYSRPSHFDKDKKRSELNLLPSNTVISFAALGDFARKGLPELLESLALLKENDNFKILVIGGKPNEIENYRQMAKTLGVDDHIVFTGFKNDIRPYLWMSDLFALPSLYEIFPLVCIQAAAAGIPLMACKMHGVEEYLEPGKNGWLIERNPRSISKVLVDIANGKYDLRVMGQEARKTALQYDHESFRTKWIDIYENLTS